MRFIGEGSFGLVFEIEHEDFGAFSKAQTEFDWLVYNAPKAYARLLPNGELKSYLMLISGLEQ